MCTVNTAHNCPRNNCSSNGFQYIYQERVQTAHQRSVVLHSAQPDDRVLNTAQMRDAEFLQRFRLPSATLTPADEEQLLHDSVTVTINARKAAGAAATGGGVPRGRGRGRGGSPAEGSALGPRGRGRGRGIGIGPSTVTVTSSQT